MAVRTVAIWNRAAAGADELALTDRELLRRFATARDEEAFAILVSRHARMVLGVCRRLLPTIQDAEDACQATFVILARKASERWQPSVANWLYTTARYVAAKARRSAARRLKREGQTAVPESLSPRDDLSASELLAILDEELGRLPARYREPLVLCYLEGLSREEAAARLGIPQGTVKTQLERGRARLEAALKRRGVGVGLGLMTLAVATPSTASSPTLVEAILAAVSAPNPAVAALARGTFMNATYHKALVAIAAVISAAGLGIGLNALIQAAESHEESPTKSAFVLEPAVKPEVVAPIPQPAAEKFETEIAAAREKAIGFLKKQQKDGKWEGAVLALLGDMEGGATALVTLCLLEAGVPANDPAVTKAIEYLVKLEPKKTYVVSLQTQVLARVDAKTHKEQIQKNVDWLLKEAVQTKDKLAGWSYPANTITDNSNTHFAVMALHAAARAGAKIEAKVWEQIRDYYIRTQARNGGWSYSYPIAGNATPTTLSMTICGVLGLAVAARHDENAKEADKALENGMSALLNLLSMNGKSAAYEWMATAELGRTLDKTEFKAGDKGVAWYREGAEKLLKSQKDDGSWEGKGGVDANPVLTTACGLYFLGRPKK